MKSKVLSLILAVCTLCSLLVSPASAVGGDSAVQMVQALGILDGTDLESPVTRAEFSKMLVAASSYKDSVSSEGSGYSLFRDVKSSYWASEYIRCAVSEGWMTGYTDGTFRPDETVKLEEACAAVLKLLGYDTSALAGSFPSAQLSKAAALGLRDGISLKQGGTMARRDCAALFSNLMTAKTSGGQIYAETLGYTVTNGEVDYTALTLENLSGPYVAENSSTSLPFQPATVYRNGEISSSAVLNQYDVYYYDQGSSTLWIYTDRVSGKITELSPSATSPTSVTVAGAAATYKLSALGGGKAGTIVTLLLGMDGSVVDVLTGTSVEAVYYGMVESSEKVVAEDGNAAVQTNVTVLCTDGTAKTFAVDKAMDYKAGRLVSVNVSEGSVTIKTLTEKHTSGKVNSTATKLGDLSFADNVEILDTSSEGTAAAVDASRLSGMSLDSDDIRYYGLNEEGRIEYLILDDVTGDLWTYAYLTNLEDQSQEMSINVTYTYLVDGTEQTLRSASVKYPVETGGIAIAYKSDGSIQTMQRMKSVKLTELSGSWAMASNQRYAIADDVQVYLRKNGSYYLTALSAVNVEDYTLTGWYNNSSSSAGRQIRIIIATALES
mgnify:CR=1 FL=1